MNTIKRPRNQTWMGVDASVYVVPISVREYHLRLDQMIETLYAELSQLPEIKTSPTILIDANPCLHTINWENIPEEEEFYGVA